MVARLDRSNHSVAPCWCVWCVWLVHLPSARVGVFQWVVQAIAVAVEVLGVAWVLHIAVNGKEAAHHGVVHASIHINEAEVVKHFVAGEASIEHAMGGVGACPSVWVARVAPGVVAEFLQGFAFVGKICSGCFHCFAFHGAKIGKLLLSFQMVFEKSPRRVGSGAY